MFLIIAEAKRNHFRFFTRNFETVVTLFLFLIKYKHKMTQCNTLNVKMSNSKLYKLKSGINNGIEVTLKLSSNVIGNSNEDINFSHKLLH